MSHSHSTPSHGFWDDRYQAARAALLDTGRVLEMRRRVAPQPMGPATRPMALAGDDVLADAQRVAVFAGSFNPLTRAHEVVIQSAKRSLSFDVRAWAMARVTVDKERVERASVADRMVQLDSYVRHAEVANALILLDAGLYADQARSLRALLPAEAALWLVVGFDKVVQIFDPAYYVDRAEALERLFHAARLLVAPRAGHTRHDLDELLAQPANTRYAAYVDYLTLDADVSSIASSQLRAEASQRAAGDSDDWTRDLTPEGAALTWATGAYVAPQPLASGEMLDVYALRQRWLSAIEQTAPGDRPAVPFEHLMNVSTAPTDAGALARRWLAGDRWPGAPDTVTDVLQRYG